MKTTNRQLCSALFALLAISIPARVMTAQCDNKTGFARKACEVGAGNASVLKSLAQGKHGTGKSDALTTNFADAIHLDTLPPDFEPKAFKSLTRLERSDDGSFLLKPGFYEAYVESYSLDPGDGNAPRVAGFYPAPIKGSRASVIADTLKQIELHPDVPQGDIQGLLSAIVAGTNLEKMPPPMQQTAARILPRETLAKIQGSVIANATEKALLGILNHRLSGQAQPKQSAPATPAEIPRSPAPDASADAASDSDSTPVLRGTWAQMPGGFYVRYLPEGTSKVRLQVIVPDKAMAEADPAHPLAFDPTQYLAVYSQAPAQRLGISLRQIGATKR
jgi:hypothetical protein